MRLPRALVRLAALASVAAAGCAAAPPPPPPPSAPPAPQIAPPVSPLGAPVPSFTGAVVRIETRGAASSEDLLRRTLVTHVGERFDAARVQEDLRSLWALSRFDDVSVEAERVAEGVVLTYVVVERPPVGRLTLAGSKQIPEPELMSLVSELHGKPADPAAIDAAVRRVRARYVELGFRLARVETESSRVAAGPVEVRFLIDEGPRVVLDRWAFTGNVAVTEADLRARMQSAPYNVAGGLYDEDRWARDVVILSAYYFDRGMLEVQIGPAEVKPSADGSVLSVTVPVVEGPVFHLGKIEVVDAARKGAPAPAGVVHVKHGEVFSRTRLIADIDRLRAFFSRERHRHVDVSPTTAIDVPGARVDIAFHVTDAPPLPSPPSP